MNTNSLLRTVPLLVMIPILLTAQSARLQDPITLKYWASPLYWQPAIETAGEPSLATAAATTSLPSAANALIFVAMTPCRVVDTRTTQGFTGAFGPPSLVGRANRTFPIQSSATCAIPSVAQAYSFNITVVPPGPLGYVTAYPTGQSVPLAATVNSPQGFIVGNAAIVAAGNNGSVDVYASDPTDIVIDMNGYYAPITSTVYNTALGFGALENNTSGGQNTATGYQALQNNTTGFANTGIGNVALNSNTTGGQNTALGDSALYSNTTGSVNTAVGYQALQLSTTGAGNTAIGDLALYANITGNNNIAIGLAAANLVSSAASNNIHIGSQGASSDNGTVRIGSKTQSSFFVAGVRGVTTGNSDAIPVMIDSNGQLGTVSSSRRFKEDIIDMGAASHDLLRLRPVTYHYKEPFADGSKPIQYGLIAEEVDEVYPNLVARSADGQIETVKYQVLDSMLLNELQNEHRQIEHQAEVIRLLETRIAALEQLLPSKASAPTPPSQ